MFDIFLEIMINIFIQGIKNIFYYFLLDGYTTWHFSTIKSNYWKYMKPPYIWQEIFIYPYISKADC